uniref:Inactive ubiquitin carboxylterminal hydrolase putati n=1 Tax=Albugo laibachii Nc14 TaxID=890382 RepID=F0WM01_9STRA|nr:inactive ubiquitin carboxylterminal hydrolase putati [Albugo laibachii Nc14]|eukprot:CCA22328.1 inactive ubiquitin carboxylterminal hydrolase putati [Albugo laibachii Nc14]
MLHRSQRKGLHNDIGENNCFLNVIVQSLWHIRSFRAIITAGEHTVHHLIQIKSIKTGETVGDPCLLCELERIFIDYKFGQAPVLQVSSLREALSRNFEMGAMNDATETLETILDTLHIDTFHRLSRMRIRSSCQAEENHSTTFSAEVSALSCEPYCIAHLLFQMNLMELSTCLKCQEMAEPMMNTDFLYRVYAGEILRHGQREYSFEQLLRIGAQEEIVDGECEIGRRKCSHCSNGSMQFARWILTLPMVFAISIMWPSTSASHSDLGILMRLLSTQQAQYSNDDPLLQRQVLDLNKIFRLADHQDHAQDDADVSTSSEYYFRGMVCYYGRHYVGFFASRSVEEDRHVEKWYLFDDTRVKCVGDWNDVRQRVERGGYQPTLLFYERKDLKEDDLERMATEIKMWWKSSTTSTNVLENGEALVSVEIHADDAVVPPVQATKHASRPPKSGQQFQEEWNNKKHLTKLPTSPIQSLPGISWDNPTSFRRSHTDWERDVKEIVRLHHSAEQTIHRLAALVGSKQTENSTRVQATSSNTISTDLLRMSQRFRAPSELLSASHMRITTRREYSAPSRLRKEQAQHIDRDAIFEDIEFQGNRVQKPVQSRLISNAQGEVNVSITVYEIVCNASDGGLGVVLSPVSKEVLDCFNKTERCVPRYLISAFERNGLGERLWLESSGKVNIGDGILGIQNHWIVEDEYYEVLELLWTSKNPVKLALARIGSWHCPHCTLINSVAHLSCAACEFRVRYFNISDD